MTNKNWQKISKFSLILTAALGLTVISNQTTHASRVSRLPRIQRSTQVAKRPAQRSIKSGNYRVNPQPNANQDVNSSSQGNLVGTNHLIRHHYINLKAQAAVAIDGRTGQVVYAKHANQKRLVASTGKLMTFYLAEKKLARNPQAWNQKLKISRPIAEMGRNPSFDSFKFNAHRRYKLSTIFKSAFIASDDDAATRLGQWVGGTNHHFIKMMNRQARQWHLNATFTSASGLENGDLAPYGFWIRGRKTSGNLISAKSLGIIAYHLINDYPQIMKDSRIKKTSVDGHLLKNENRLLPGNGWYRHHLHTDGLKTGYTPRAGLCFVGTGKRPDRDRLITVVLHDPVEFSDTDDLMNFVYKYSNLYNK